LLEFLGDAHLLKQQPRAAVRDGLAGGVIRRSGL